MGKRKNELLQASSAWTPERRARHAEAIRRWKPWEKSTGPRSAAGKARSSRNAMLSPLRLHLHKLKLQLDWEWRELEREGRLFTHLDAWIARLRAGGRDPANFEPPQLPGRPAAPPPFPGILDKPWPAKAVPTRRRKARAAPARRAH